MEETLRAVLSGSNEERAAAEAALQASPLQQLLPALAAAVGGENSSGRSEKLGPAEQQLAAVLLRNCVHSRWQELLQPPPSAHPEGQQQQVEELQRQQVLQLQQQLIATLLEKAMSHATDVAVQKSAADAVVEIWKETPSRSLEDAPCRAALGWLQQHLSQLQQYMQHMQLLQQQQSGQLQQLGNQVTEAAAALSASAAAAAGWWRLCDRIVEDAAVGRSFVDEYAELLCCCMQQTLQLPALLLHLGSAAAAHPPEMPSALGSELSCLQTLVSCLNAVPGSSHAVERFYALAPTVVDLLRATAAPSFSSASFSSSRSDFSSSNYSREFFAAAEQLAQAKPKFYHTQHLQLLELAIGLSGYSGLHQQQQQQQQQQHLAPEEVRVGALRLATTALLASPRWSKKNLPRVRALTEVLFACAGEENETEEEWMSVEREEEDGSCGSNSDCGGMQEQALRLLSLIFQRLRSTEATACFFQICKAALRDDKWQLQWGALLLLADLLDEDAAGADIDLLKHVDWMLEVALQRLHAAPGRLRWAALNCVCGVLQQQQQAAAAEPRERLLLRDQQLLQLLLQQLQQETLDRCRRKSLRALALLFTTYIPDEEEEEEERAVTQQQLQHATAATAAEATEADGVYAALSPYIEEILAKVVVPLCDSSDPQTQELALALASTLASVSGRHFVRHYSFFMCAIRKLLQLDPAVIAAAAADSKKQRSLPLLLEAAVEFAGVLAAAVGRDTFAPDAPWLVRRLLELQRVCSNGSDSSNGSSSNGTADNVLDTYAGASLQVAAIEASSQIADVLGEQMLPFLDELSPLLLAKIQQHVDVHYMESIGSSSERAATNATIREDGRVATVQIKDKTGVEAKISIDTAAVEEKVTAVKLLRSLAAKLKRQLPAALATAWLDVLLNEIRDASFALVKKAACEAVPAVLSCEALQEDASLLAAACRKALAVCAGGVAAAAATPRQHISSFYLPATTEILTLLGANKQRVRAAVALAQEKEAADAAPAAGAPTAAAGAAPAGTAEAGAAAPGTAAPGTAAPGTAAAGTAAAGTAAAGTAAAGTAAAGTAAAGTAAADLLFNTTQELCDGFLSQIFEGLGRFIVPVLTERFESLARKEQRASGAHEDDGEGPEDEEDEEDAEEEETADEAYDASMQCTGSLFKLYGSACLPYFDKHLKNPYGALLAHGGTSSSAKASALCIFADVLNYGGEAAGRYYGEIFFSAAVLAAAPKEKAISDDETLAVSAAAYGIGALAVHARPQMLPRLSVARAALTAALDSLALHVAGGRDAQDCAACALLKLYLFYPQEMAVEMLKEGSAAAGTAAPAEPVAAALSSLLQQWFPLLSDEQEIEVSEQLLCSTVKENHPLLQSSAVRQQVQRVLSLHLEKKNKAAASAAPGAACPAVGAAVPDAAAPVALAPAADPVILYACQQLTQALEKLKFYPALPSCA